MQSQGLVENSELRNTILSKNGPSCLEKRRTNHSCHLLTSCFHSISHSVYFKCSSPRSRQEEAQLSRTGRGCLGLGKLSFFLTTARCTNSKNFIDTQKSRVHQNHLILGELDSHGRGVSRKGGREGAGTTRTDTVSSPSIHDGYYPSGIRGGMTPCLFLPLPRREKQRRPSRFTFKWLSALTLHPPPGGWKREGR